MSNKRGSLEWLREKLADCFEQAFRLAMADPDWKNFGAVAKLANNLSGLNAQEFTQRQDRRLEEIADQVEDTYKKIVRAQAENRRLGLTLDLVGDSTDSTRNLQ